MKLTTSIPLVPKYPKITYSSFLVQLGSCFANNMGERLQHFKFNHITNPFGVLFHSKAIETLLWMSVNREKYTKEDLFNYNELWHSFDAHSSLSQSDAGEVVVTLNKRLSELYDYLKVATHLSITLGTAWVYRLTSIDLVVANCHKVPASEFSKELLSVKEVTNSLLNCLELIRQVNPSMEVIFTVSPVRHKKDGFIENNRSKAHLFAAIHNVQENDKFIHYFPSYEIMMDELRDYRFYTPDMLHPNSTAVAIIWERFCQTWIHKDTRQEMKVIDQIQKSMAHRPLHPNTLSHTTFTKELQEKINGIKEKFPFMQFDTLEK